MEKCGERLITRLICTWKTDNDEVQERRAKGLVEVIAKRASGGPARYLCIDATNERLFARRMQQQFRGICSVELVVGSEKKTGAAVDDVNMKTLLGTKYVDTLQRGQLDLPAHDYVKEDHRLVRRDSGHFVCSPTSDGKHGDTFDSGKLALHGLKSIATEAEIVRQMESILASMRKGRAGMPYIERWKLNQPRSKWR